jgi:alpha-ketoglutarate-dependent taurine dioxygenase
VQVSKQNIEAIYPLSPLQQGMLFHTVCAPGSGVYVTQSCWLLRGKLDVEALKQAWQQVINRYPSLRAAFVWENRDEPLQVIIRNPSLPWEEREIGELMEAERNAYLSALFEEDRQRGFDITKPLLLRLFLLRAASDLYYFMCSYHHLLMDGWSAALVLSQVFEFYEAKSRGQELKLPAPHSFKDYLALLKRRNASESESFWRQTLKGFFAPTPLPDDLAPEQLPGQHGRHEAKDIRLSAATTAALQSLVRQNQVTLNTLVQGLWALLLGYYSGKDDVVFGTIVSGRPPELEGVESIVGVFINNLPIRVKLLPELPLWRWLKEIQAQHVAIRQHQHISLIHIKEWSDLPRGASLFESLLVFDNYPVNQALQNSESKTRSVEIENLLGADQNNYPITVTTGPAKEISLEINYDTNRFQASTINRILSHFEMLFESLSKTNEITVGRLKEVLLESDRRQQTMQEKKIGESNLSKFRKITPKKIMAEPESLVRTRLLQADQPLPLVIEPVTDDIHLQGWAKSNIELIEKSLLTHGAILFRGFSIKQPDDFEQFAKAICPDLLNENGEHNRQSVSGNVYTPVAYPADKHLLWHNENSFNYQWPRKLFFCCLEPAKQGGETPIVDSRKVFESLDEHIKQPFLEKGVMYVRNYGEGLGLSWEMIFQTSDKSEVEAACRRGHFQFSWKEKNRLITRSVRPAMVRHPATGEPVWFNQAQHWHLACLEPEVRKALTIAFAEDDLPRNCYYGDGSQIDDSAMHAILDVYRRFEVSFPWQSGDVLLLDNLLTAHGRNPYSGERKQLVAMGELLTYADVSSR